MTQFEALGLSNQILKSIEKIGYKIPTPIQVQAIPHVLEGRDLMGLAQTGTGKTAAFGLPLAQKLLAENTRPAPKTVHGLILAPTRELANQIAANLREYVRDTPIKVHVVVGGSSINVQRKNLERGTDILVATPGRLLDLVERGAVKLGTAKYLVLDEADQMLDLGFIHALRKIAKLVATPRQTLLFSATMPKLIAELSRTYLDNPVRVETATPGKAADKVNQSVHLIGLGISKGDLLKNLLSERPDDLSLVFARTKHGAEKLMKSLVAAGFKAGSIHGNKSQGQRERSIKAFKDGDVRILVATDVAARGIDIQGISHVYNFDLPDVAENYVHRIGRTARAGAAGEAVAFCSAPEYHLLCEIEKLMKIEIPIISGSLTDEEKRTSRAVSRANAKGRGGQGGRSHRGQGGAPKGGAPGGGGKPGGQKRRSGQKQGDSANSNRAGKWRGQKRKPAAA